MARKITLLLPILLRQERVLMKRYLVLVLAILGLSCALSAQVTDTTVCDVVKKPASFDGKMVRIKGTVVAGFDEFVIKDAADPNCGYPVNAIWLSYPQGSKGKAGPTAMLTIQPARNYTGKYTPPTRTPVTLTKDKDFKQFDNLLAQTHQKGADMCLGCTRYEVKATLVGRLDAVADASLTRDAAGKITGFGGFGNMNAYPTRLVLQSVTDVTPKEIDYSKSDAVTNGEPALQSGSGADIYGSITTAQKIAEGLSASPPKDAAVKATAVYGTSGQRTGVYVNEGTANEAAAKDEALGTKDSPDGVLFNCTFNTDRLQGNALTRAVVHMGEHVSDVRTAQDSLLFVSEYNAWINTAIQALFSGQKFLTLPGSYVVWNANWPAADRNEKIDSTLKDFLANEALLSR